MSLAPEQTPGAGGLVPRPGELVANRYQLEREIARGGMGAVWAAHDPKLRRSVAIKLLAGSWGTSEEAKRRFEREAMAVARLQCPQVVQIFDYGLERGVPFIVMELLEGEDLQKRLKHKKRLTLEEAVNIVWHTAKALGVAHAAGIVHRDLKPGNVFLVVQGGEEIVKVLDFGVAKTEPSDDTRKASALVGTPQHRIEVDDRTKVGTLLGTPQYMSPEQARGIGKIDHRADLWSLGCIAYRMLTGKLPFNGRTAAEVIAVVVAAKPVPPSEVAPDLPPELDAFFERAFARDLSQRFSSAREMARAFSAVSSMSLPTISVPEPRLPMSSDPSWPDIYGPESGIRSGKFTPPPRSSSPGRLLEELTGPSSYPTGSGRLEALESTLPGAGVSIPPSVAPAAPHIETVEPEPEPRRSSCGMTLLLLVLAIGALTLWTGPRIAAWAASRGIELPWSKPELEPPKPQAPPPVVSASAAPAASNVEAPRPPVVIEAPPAELSPTPHKRPAASPDPKPSAAPPQPALPADPFEERL